MAPHHLDEGALGWLLAALALVGGMGLCGVGAYVGARVARFVDNDLAHFN